MPMLLLQLMKMPHFMPARLPRRMNVQGENYRENEKQFSIISMIIILCVPYIHFFYDHTSGLFFIISKS